MRPLVHPRAEEISLHALADPIRLGLSRTLCRDRTGPVSRIRCAPCTMPGSSLSRHFHILREAGLVRSERRGAELVNMARDDKVEARFPGPLWDSFADHALVRDVEAGLYFDPERMRVLARKGGGRRQHRRRAGETRPSRRAGACDSGIFSLSTAVLGAIDARTNAFLGNAATGVGAHAVSADAVDNHVFVPLPPDPADPGCLKGCVGVYARSKQPQPGGAPAASVPD